MQEDINMHKDNTPKISIIVPCYNQAEYLTETLQSIKDQKFQDWECIIVNDGSPDDTEGIAKGFEMSRAGGYVERTEDVGKVAAFTQSAVLFVGPG